MAAMEPLLVELGTEELPVKALPGLAQAFFDNMIDGLVITFVDITRTKLLQQSERRLVEGLQRSPVSVFGQDRDLRFSWACAAVLGRRFEDLLGKTDEEAFGADNAARLTRLKRTAIDANRPVRERVALQLNGSERVYDLFVEPHRNGSGETEGVTCVATDLTDSARS